MWLMTPRGFYSVVQHREKPTVVLVRTRNEQDIRNLLPLLPDDTKPIEMQHSDYAWRVEIPVVEWVGALSRMALEIDYDNFKSRVGKVSPRHSAAYHKIWTDLLSIEDHAPGKRSATAQDRGHWRFGGSTYGTGYATGYEGSTATQGGGQGGKGKGKKGKKGKGKNRKAGDNTQPNPTLPQLAPLDPPRSYSADSVGPDDWPMPEVGQQYAEFGEDGMWWEVIECIGGEGQREPAVRLKRLDTDQVRRESLEDLAVFYDKLPTATVPTDD